MSYYSHGFEGQISLLGVGKAKVLTYTVIFLPAELEAELPFKTYPRLRVEGEIAEVPVRGAWMPVGDGRRYFIIAPEVKKNSGYDVGDWVEMRFRIDDQEFVDVPAALASAIAADRGLSEKWSTLSAGKKRMSAIHVASAKTPPTQARRIEDVIEALTLGCTVRELKTKRKT